MVSCKEFKNKRLLSRKIRFYLSKEQRYAYAIFLKENNLPIDYVNDLDDSVIRLWFKKNIGIKELLVKPLKLLFNKQKG
ncbi:hypothetical protein [Faecalibacillus intestinalis]|uniref:hypothetical protein n=1 Tax=Faecalibacillus intestinalis TaxID=1982626 RepID=UPI0039917D84